MTIRITAQARARMEAEARRAYPEEACGLLIGRAAAAGASTTRVLRAEPVSNARADERGRRYLIPPEVVLEREAAARREGLELVGFFHSHPDHPAAPSEFDREHAWPWYAYVIVPVGADGPGRIRAWRLKDDRSSFGEQELVTMEEEPT